MDNITNLNIDLLIPNPNQPRKNFNESSIIELSNSIKQYGILNPILVIKKDEKYEIIAGERRYRAAKLIGLKEVPVIIKNIDINTAKEIALIENLQRENLNPIEEAKTYQEIIKSLNITEQELGEKIGKSQSAIANKIRLLNLPNTIIDAIINKKISEKHARTLLSITEDKEKEKLLQEIIEKKLTVKELENKIKEEKESDNMNNGNFFPNFNTQPINQNVASLNTLNQQSMETQQIAASTVSQETVMPTENIVSVNQNSNIELQKPQEIKEVKDTPLFNQSVEIPNINGNVNSQEQSTIDPFANIVPIVAPQQESQVPTLNVPNENIVQAVSMPTEEPITIPQIDIPLFNQNIEMSNVNVENVQQVPIPTFENSIQTVSTENVSIQQQNTMEPTNEIQNIEIPVEKIAPVVVSQVEVPIQEDKLNVLETFLKEKQIAYKLYGNETGHCIIIEV